MRSCWRPQTGASWRRLVDFMLPTVPQMLSSILLFHLLFHLLAAAMATAAGQHQCSLDGAGRGDSLMRVALCLRQSAIRKRTSAK